MKTPHKATLAVVAAYCVHAAVHARHTFSEAGFSIAAADALATGQGLSPWSGAAWTESFARPLWVALLTLPVSLGLPTAASATVLGGLLGLGGLGLVGATAHRLGARGPWPWLAALAVALHPWWTIWTVSASGEVLYAVLALAGLLRLTLEAEDDRRVPLGGLLLGLSGLARWDAAIPLVVVAPMVVVLGRRRRHVGWTLSTLALMAGPSLAWVGFRQAMWGRWLPPVAYRWTGSTHFGLEAALRGAGRTLWRHDSHLTATAALTTLAGVVATARRPETRARTGLFLVALLAELIALVAVRGDWVSSGRRMHAMIALCAPVAAVGMQATWLRTRDARWGRRALGGLLLLALAHQVDRSAYFYHYPETLLSHLKRRTDHILDHARAHGIPSPSLADPDPQAWLVYTDLPVIDLSGRSSAANPIRREAVNAQILSDNGPTYVHLHGGWEKVYKTRRDPRWDALYVEIEPYPLPAGRFHIGTYVRRSALASAPVVP